MEKFQSKIDEFKKLLAEREHKIVVLGHTNPDGDAIGSVAAMSAALEAQGHEVMRVVPNRFPAFLDWMPDAGRFLIFKNDHEGIVAKAVAEATMIICMDFNQISRLELLSDTIHANTTAYRILIDHHLEAPNEYDIMFSYSNTSSTSYLAYKIIAGLWGEDAVTLPMAEALYTGIMTDTGNFSFSYLTPDLFRIVASLVEKGVDIPKINQAVYNSYSEGRMRLLGYSLYSSMNVMHEYGVSYITLTEEEMRRFKFQQGDSEGFVNFPLAIGKVFMSAMFIETKQFIRVSLRSRGDIDVNSFARKYFQGGGHKNAAGGKSTVSMEETVKHFRTSVKEFFKCR